MKILQSNITLTSQHTKKHELKESESLVKWSGRENDPRQRSAQDRLELSDDFNALKDAELDPKLQAIVRALESLMGRKLNLSFLHNLSRDDAQEALSVGWGVDYSYEKEESLEESLDFSASGNVTTASGKSIEFSLAFSMHYEMHSKESFSFKAGDALIDPLVVNFDSNIVTLSDIKHEFDLDLDGKSDSFSFVGSGSGFLALDKNKDGKINDGSELFGPKTSNGFDELRAYDSDKNNFIDENDDIYSQLLIWTKDEDGTEHLFHLKEKNIGAIYLNNVESEFDINQAYTMKGKLKESSIYLKEDGSGVGSVGEVDLVV